VLKVNHQGGHRGALVWQRKQEGCMTPKTIHLNKLLKLLQLQDAKLTSALRSELRAERDKVLGLNAIRINASSHGMGESGIAGTWENQMSEAKLLYVVQTLKSPARYELGLDAS
jgi:hypothetical protein